MITIKAKRNIWGNWNGYEGRARCHEFGTSEFDAREWISERLLMNNCTLSPDSDITMTDVERHREKLS